jgi:(1->4)-alpha-D-glucan 1-alpha-D-glucosylmutase
VEDTAFYRYHVLASLGEVGGDPRRFGRSVAEVHQANADRRRDWPGEMLATTTHDTKRSEDARARINVLSELPEAWQAAVARWRRINQPNRTKLAGGVSPDANDEYLFYQALAGVWPVDQAEQAPEAAPADLVARLMAYMDKAIKEAKLHTSWITPNVDYEAGVGRFVERTLTGATAAAFLDAFVPFARRVGRGGMANSLAQLAIKLAAPGVPDFYQGTELWDQSLVDPDNRRSVDWDRRRTLLAELDPWLAGTTLAGPGRPELASFVQRLVAAWPDGRIKLWVTAIGMRARRERPDVFLDGDYAPLEAAGAHAAHVFAFARRIGADQIVAIAPRLTTRLTGGARLPLGVETWDDTGIPWPAADGRVVRDLITGRRLEPSADGTGAGIRLADALRICPVALLWAEPA